MESVPKSIQKVQASLEPYVKPREQVAYIRRALALHLQACGQPGPIQKPLSLVDSSCRVTPTQEVRGLQKEYLKALDANLKARNEYENIRYETVTTATSRTKNVDTSDQVEEHVALIKLRQKHQRLQTVQKYLDLLVHQPAASSDFLDLGDIFSDSSLLPNVPKEVVSGFVVGASTNETDLGGLAGQLEKVVLRAKLLLQREEQLLADVRQRTGPLAGHVRDEAKVHALDTTRTELINWIETELSKASGESDDTTASQGNGFNSRTEQEAIDEHLAKIKDKYSRYTATRKAVLNIVSEQTQPVLKPRDEGTSSSGQSQGIPAEPTTHLLIPYLDKLLSLSREQKGMITQKSHIHTVLAKQTKETRQALDHLAEESQLLPLHPMPGTGRPKSGFGEDFSAAMSEKPMSSDRVKPWVFAADSAKIATLEAVAEKIEEGQVALEGSMPVLQEVDKLLGQRSKEPEEEAVGDMTEEDIWLTQGSAKKAGARKHATHQRKESTVNPDDIWSAIDGKLGLIG
ncbi:uncharacterized protein ColSpa_02345 [Colletotrichum spaethianum]|uniref:Uncharacterized protein n=1 Tax=Colletotrichum spaethianum TaxID=700344 RepID=A0AA37L8X3_9PEZI|nr:uncharacterized protein ColSpa_02345 [Colletotrichum spaethianum]GKT42164.1 hypothetical protein ColSpa_02345 [Colletotrichum spaethianum]